MLARPCELVGGNRLHGKQGPWSGQRERSPRLDPRRPGGDACTQAWETPHDRPDRHCISCAGVSFIHSRGHEDPYPPGCHRLGHFPQHFPVCGRACLLDSWSQPVPGVCHSASSLRRRDGRGCAAGGGQCRTLSPPGDAVYQCPGCPRGGATGGYAIPDGQRWLALGSRSVRIQTLTYSNANTRFQSFFMLTTVHPLATASSYNACEKVPTLVAGSPCAGP